MKLATLALAAALTATGGFALAVRRYLHGRKYGGRRGDRHDGRIVRQRNDNREFDRCAEQRHVDRRRQCRGRTGQWAESVRQHQYQPLAQRLDPGADRTRLVYRPITKSPALRGFFVSMVAGCYFFSSSSLRYFSTSRVTSWPSTSLACSLASGATVERS